MTLKNYRVPLLCFFKLCASFHSHQWTLTGVTVRKRPIWVKFDDFFSSVTLKFDRWPYKTIGHLFYATSSFVHHFIIICEFKLELQSGNGWVLTSLTLIFDLWPWSFAWTLLWSLVITSENFRMIRWWEHSEKGVADGQTDRQTDNTIHRAAWSQLNCRADDCLSNKCIEGCRRNCLQRQQSHRFFLVISDG